MTARARYTQPTEYSRSGASIWRRIFQASSLSPEERQHLIKTLEADSAQLLALPEDRRDPATELERLCERIAVLSAAGDVRSTLPLREMALVLAKRLHGLDSPTTLSLLAELAGGYLWLGDLERGEAFTRFALERLEAMEAAGEPFPEVRAELLHALGQALFARWKCKEALTAYEQALRLCETAPSLSLLGATLKNQFGVILSAMVRYEEAVSFLQQACAELEQELGPDHPERAGILTNLRWVLKKLNRVVEAEQYAQIARQIRQAALEPDHPEHIHDLTIAADEMPDLEEAERIYRQALAIAQVRLSERSDSTALLHLHLGYNLLNQNRLKEAEPVLRHAVDIYQSRAPLHPVAGMCWRGLGIVHFSRQELLEAERCFTRALDLYEATLLSNSSFLPPLLFDIGHCYLLRKQFAPAESMLRWALLVLEQTDPAAHSNVGAFHNLLGLALFEQRKDTEAEVHFYRALDFYEASYGRQHPSLFDPLANLATLCFVSRAFARAEPFYEWLLALQELHPHLQDPPTCAIWNSLGVCRYHQKNYRQAEQAFRQALEDCQQRPGVPHPDLPVYYENLAVVLSELGQNLESARYRGLAARLRDGRRSLR